MQKETYNRLLNEKLNEIQEISEKNIYYFKDLHNSSINFIRFKGPFGFSEKIKNGDISLEEAEKRQEDFKKSLGQITSGNPKHKEKNQQDTTKNVKNLYNLRHKIIDLFDNSAKIKTETIHKSKQNETTGTGLKIVTP